MVYVRAPSGDHHGPSPPNGDSDLSCLKSGGTDSFTGSVTDGTATNVRTDLANCAMTAVSPFGESNTSHPGQIPATVAKTRAGSCPDRTTDHRVVPENKKTLLGSRREKCGQPYPGVWLRARGSSGISVRSDPPVACMTANSGCADGALNEDARSCDRNASCHLA